MCRGRPYLMDPKEIQEKPNGYVRKFVDMAAANAFRAMIYRAGRRAERSRVYDTKAQVTKIHITVFDKDFVK